MSELYSLKAIRENFDIYIPGEEARKFAEISGYINNENYFSYGIRKIDGYPYIMVSLKFAQEYRNWVIDGLNKRYGTHLN